MKIELTQKEIIIVVGALSLLFKTDPNNMDLGHLKEKVLKQYTKELLEKEEKEEVEK